MYRLFIKSMKVIKSNVFLLSLLCGIFFLDACSDPAANSNKIDYSFLSGEYCKCTEHSMELNRKMENLFNNNKNEEIEGLIPEVGRQFKVSIDCSQKAKDGHTKKKLNKNRMEDSLKKVCPEMPQRLVTDLIDKIN